MLFYITVGTPSSSACRAEAPSEGWSSCQRGPAMNLVLVLVLVLVLDFLCSVGFTGTMRDRKFGRQFTFSPRDSALDVPKTCGTFAKTDRMPEQKLCWGMLRRRELLLPTWRGCLLILLVLLACGYCAVQGVHGF